MASSFDEYKKLHEQALAEAEANKQQIQQRQVQHTVNGVDPTHQYKAWDDVWGNVYMSDLTTGQTKRTHNNLINVGAPRELSRGTVVEDLGQAVTGAMQRQGANYKSAGATLLLGMADLFNGKDPYQPEVGSFLWRMQQGAQADTALANQTLADAKYGRGKVGSLVMDLTSGAVDLASDALLTAATGGASIGGKLGITAGLGAMGARSFGGGAEEAREQGKSTGQQFITGLKSAGIEMLTEKIGGPFESVYGSTALGRFTNDLTSRLSKSAGMKFVLNRISNFSDEALEEMLSDVLNPLADRVLKLDNGEGWEQLWTKEGMSQMAYDGLVGGLLGLFGGMAEGLSPEQRAQAAIENMDNAMNASRNGKSIGAELEQDTEGRVANAVTNQASQTAPEVPFTVGAQEAKEVPVAPTPTEIAPSPQTAVKQEAGEFNAEPNVEQPKQKRIGKKTARDIAFDAWFNDNIRQGAEPEGVAVDSSDFASEVSTTEPESGKVEARKVAPTAAERLANYNNPQTTDAANRGLKGRVESAVRNALAQNGIDYSNDPRSDYYDDNTGEYREEDLDLLDEESRAKYLSDMRQIRLLDAVDEWLDKNGQRYLSANKGSEAEVQQGLQDALNDYVRRYLDSQTDKASNSEAVEDVMQQRRQDDRLKSLAKEEKQKAPTGYNTVQVGDNLFRVTGPGGITTTEVADNSADAVQKHIDGLTEENRKKAKERKAKEQELKKLRQEVQESQENPTQIEGSDGKLYEVTKELTRGENNYQYVVTELDEDGLPTDMEARIFRKNANSEEEAVQHAIEHPEFFNDGSVEGEDWGERSDNEAKGNQRAGREDVHTESPGDGRGEGSVSLGPRNYSGRDYSSERSGDFQPSSNYTEEDTGGLTPQKVNESFAQEAAKIEQFGEGAIPVYLSGWQGDFADFIQFFVDGDVAWFIPGSKRFAAAFYHGASDSIGFSTGSDKLTTKQGCLAFGAHELAHRWFLKKFGKNIGAESKKFNDAVLQTAGFDKAQSEALRYYVGKWYLIKAGIPSQIKTDLETWYPIISEMLSDDKEFSSEVEQEISSRLLSGEFVDFFGKHDIMSPAKFQAAQNAARETADKLGIQRKDVLSLFPTVAEIENDSYDRWNEIEKFLTNQRTSELSHEEPPQPKRSAPPSDLNETLNEMSRERDSKSKAKDADFEAKRAEDKQQTNAKEYAYNKKLDAEEAGEPSAEDKAKSTFGDGYDKVQKSAEDFGKIKTRFDEDAFKESGKKQDKATRNKLGKLRELFTNAATTGDVESLFSFYESLKDDSNLSNFYNEDVQEDIDNFRKLVDENLDTYNEGAAPYAAARTMQKMAHKFKLANEYQQTLLKMNETLRGSKSGVMRKIGKSEKLTSAVARALMRWQINPDTVFKMIDAFDKGNAGEGYKLAKELQEAHREKYRVLREARAKFDKASDLKGYQDFAFGKQTVKDYSGREWDMRSALSVIKAIDTIRSTSGKKIGGTDGFGVMDSKGNVEFIDMKDVDAIKLYESLKSGLSDVAIKYGELATEAFNDVKEPLRAKYKQNNGVDIGMVGDEDTRLGDKKGIEKAVYSPLSYVDKNGNVYQFDIAKQETYNNIPRFLRERSDAGGTYILIKPYTEVTGKYFEQVSNYLAYSTFNEKMRGLGKGSSYETGLGNTLADVFGKDMGNWYKSYVEDLATYQNEDDVEGVNSLLRQGRQRLQQGALLFSVSVPMKQISSYWAASGILRPDSLIQAYRIKLLKPKNSSDAATMLASRAMDNLEQSAAEAANDAKKWLGKLKYSSKFIELAANAINQMDYNTVSNLLTATEYDVLKYQFGGDKSVIGTDEYKAAVEEKFQDVVDRSQPNFDKQMRAEYGRTDNEVIRMLSMFRTQQTQNLNLLATAIGEYRAAKGTANQAAATETLKQTIAGQAASAFSLSMLTILADMLLHRQKKYEDEEQDIDMSKVLTRLGINAIEAASGTLWFGDAVAKWAIDRISGGSTKEFYGVNMGVISTVSDILENFETAIKSPTRSNIKKCAGNIATIMGIPLNNAYSMLNSAIMYAKDLTGNNEGDYDDILRYLDVQTKAAKKAEEKAAKEAAKAEAKSGADMLADTAKQNSSQSELNSAEEQKAPEVSTYLKKPYNALIEAGMSSQRSQEVLGEMDTDSNNSVKQSEMIAYYKAHPEDEQYVMAMWNSYGYKTSWESAKKKAG